MPIYNVASPAKIILKPGHRVQLDEETARALVASGALVEFDWRERDEGGEDPDIDGWDEAQAAAATPAEAAPPADDVVAPTPAEPSAAAPEPDNTQHQEDKTAPEKTASKPRGKARTTKKS